MEVVFKQHIRPCANPIYYNNGGYSYLSGLRMLSDTKSLTDTLKVALVHDRLNVIAGAERVLFKLHELFSDAPIYTAISKNDLVAPHMPEAKIHTSFVQKLPFVAKHHQRFLPLYMLAFELFDLSEFDVVISSSYCAAKAVITKPQACHISYCYSPMRYAWDMQHTYAKTQNKMMRVIWSVMANYVRLWDLGTSFRVDYFVAISRHIARRIQKFYGRPAAAVIYPPVDVDRFSISPSIDDYYLVVSRFAPYKRVDLIIQAFNRLGWRLVIIGDGEQKAYLKKIAGPNIEFKGHLSDEEVAKYFACCKASIHAAEEDFGINMVESLAAGRPVIAFSAGGAREIVAPGLSGVLFSEPTEDSLVKALMECEACKWDSKAIRASSLRFGEERFKEEFAAFTDWAVNDFRSDACEVVMHPTSVFGEGSEDDEYKESVIRR